LICRTRFDGYDRFSDLLLRYGYVRTGPVLQIGIGANDKNLAFGASTWLDVFVLSDQARQNKLFGNKHWDLNMNHTAVPVTAAVWLLGSALLGFVGMRKKAKQA